MTDWSIHLTRPPMSRDHFRNNGDDMRYGSSAPPSSLDYRDESGRVLMDKFRADFLDTYGNKSRGARYLKCDRRTVTRWFDPECEFDPCGRYLDRFCQHRALKLRVDRWLSKAPK